MESFTIPMTTCICSQALLKCVNTSSSNSLHLLCHSPPNNNTFNTSFCVLFSCILSSSARCFECNEELSTHCNKKALAQSLDFLQKHSAKATSGEWVGNSPRSGHLHMGNQAFINC